MDLKELFICDYFLGSLLGYRGIQNTIPNRNQCQRDPMWSQAQRTPRLTEEGCPVKQNQPRTKARLVLIFRAETREGRALWRTRRLSHSQPSVA